MGILENIKNAAKKYDIPQGGAEEQQLTKIVNALFLLPKKPEEEARFVQTVATRGLKTQERRGLHASGIIASDDKFCYRAQVLCQFYRQDGSKNLPVNLLRIFDANKRHPTASLQLQLYLHLTALKHGFVLCENKNSQEFKIEYCEYNLEVVKPYINRLEKVRKYTAIFAKKKRLIARPAGCSGPTCKKCENCIVKSTCWKLAGGGQRL